MTGKPNTKWRETMIKKLGSLEAVQEWQKSIGHRGGTKCVPKGFACMTYEKRSAAGKKGGTISRLPKKGQL